MSTDTTSKSLADSVTAGPGGAGALKVVAIIMALAGGALCILALTSAMIAEGFRLHEGRAGDLSAKAGGGAIFQRD